MQSRTKDLEASDRKFRAIFNQTFQLTGLLSPEGILLEVNQTALEKFNKLFQPFVQIDSALNLQYNGTGLGLALVKQIVEKHGGQVQVTSEVGLGSSFIIQKLMVF